MVCTGCGAEANASCNCGKPYVPAKERVKEYDNANPGRSTRQAAADLGVSRETVRKTRAGDNHLSPETVTGADGKIYPARLSREIPRSEVNEFTRESINFVKDFCFRFRAWIKQTDPLPDDAITALIRAFSVCAEEFESIRKEIE